MFLHTLVTFKIRAPSPMEQRLRSALLWNVAQTFVSGITFNRREILVQNDDLLIGYMKTTGTLGRCSLRTFNVR